MNSLRPIARERRRQAAARKAKLNELVFDCHGLCACCSCMLIVVRAHVVDVFRVDADRPRCAMDVVVPAAIVANFRLK